ncbi:Protein of unknown function [Bacillus wiedmannii]|nr:Protein of unknown function [Bacillus wiedmannii]
MRDGKSKVLVIKVI